MICNLFKLIGIEKPSYLDIGAHHPFNISNTALLYERGSRGINVEANPRLIGAFIEHRTEDVNVNVGVAKKRGHMTFFYYDETSGLNTFSESESQKRPNSFVGVLEVIGINELKKEYCGGRWPDFLSVDAEGMDLELLSTANIAKDGPSVVCVESRAAESGTMKRVMNEKGYFCLCRMGENILFVREELRSLVL